MRPYDRIMAALSGKRPDRVPVVPWVRDWCVMQAGFGITDMMENIEKYVYAQYETRKKFGYDAVFDLCAIEAVSEAMGVVIHYNNDTSPRPLQHIIHDYNQDLDKLRIPNPHRDGRLPMILCGLARLKEICRGEIPVIGYLQGPLRHAATLRSYEELLKDILRNQEPLQELLDLAVDSLIVYGEALVHAGADIVLISDPASSGDMISRKQFEKWGMPALYRVTRFLRRTGTTVILHVCGQTIDRLDLFAQLAIDGMSLDEKVDLEKARKVLGDRICIFGNVSPSSTLCFGTPKDVDRESKECIKKAGKNGPFILGSGCIIPSLAKPENIAAMVAAAEKYRCY